MTSHSRIIALAVGSMILPAIILTPMSGCLVASSKTHRISGAYIQPGAVTNVKVNQTTSDEVEEILSTPSTVTQNDDGSETWTWNWTETKDDSGAVLLVFAGSSKKTIAKSVHIKFVDGVAVKKWRD